MDSFSSSRHEAAPGVSCSNARARPDPTSDSGANLTPRRSAPAVRDPFRASLDRRGGRAGAWGPWQARGNLHIMPPPFSSAFNARRRRAAALSCAENPTRKKKPSRGSPILFTTTHGSRHGVCVERMERVQGGTLANQPPNRSIQHFRQGVRSRRRALEASNRTVFEAIQHRPIVYAQQHTQEAAALT